MTAAVAERTRLAATLHRPPGAPRALLCAVHGMGMTASYFTTHADPDATLVAAALDAGLAVLLLDRPGYGGSARLPERAWEAQVAAVEDAIADALRELGDETGAVPPLLLLGHSLGGRIVLDIAGGGRLPVAAVELSAVGYRLRGGVDGERAGRQREAWGPPGCYPPETFVLARSAIADVPPGEVVATPAWCERFAAAAATVTCPVRVAWAVHDRWWRRDAAEAAAVTMAFTRSPLVTTTTLLDAGHNLHLGRNAGEHNRQSLDFLTAVLEDTP